MLSMADEQTSTQPTPSPPRPYYDRIRELCKTNPHLESLAVYYDAIEGSKTEKGLGSFDSDSILVVDIPYAGDVSLDRINVYDPNDVVAHKEVLSGTGDSKTVRSRLLVIEDLSPGAIEALGAGLNLDPHVFYFHLGFDTRDSWMTHLVRRKSGKHIPITWYYPHHGPGNFISVPLACDIQPSEATENENAELDTTYARQSIEPIFSFQLAPRRAFNRISLAITKTPIRTTIIFMFPSWRRASSEETGLVLDSQAFTVVPPKMPLHLPPVDQLTSQEEPSRHRPDNWSESQWMRMEPLLRVLFGDKSRTSANSIDVIREKILFWMYSKVSFNYHLASQNNARCRRDFRTMTESHLISDNEAQDARGHLKDTSAEYIEMLDVAILTLDMALEDAIDIETARKWHKKVDLLLVYQRS